VVELAAAAGLQSHHPAVFTALADGNGFARGSGAKFASGNGRARVRHHAGWTANDESWQFVYAITLLRRSKLETLDGNNRLFRQTRLAQPLAQALRICG